MPSHGSQRKPLSMGLFGQRGTVDLELAAREQGLVAVLVAPAPTSPFSSKLLPPPLPSRASTPCMSSAGGSGGGHVGRMVQILAPSFASSVVLLIMETPRLRSLICKMGAVIHFRHSMFWRMRKQ